MVGQVDAGMEAPKFDRVESVGDDVALDVGHQHFIVALA
jgi:hypothetical protein